MKTLFMTSGLLMQMFFLTQSHAADKVIQPGKLTAGASGLRGVVMLKNQQPGPILQISPNSQITVDAPDANGLVNVELHSGMIRILVKAAADKKPVFNLKTKSAVMGVRGTDFVGIATPILGESEIVVMDGTVEFVSTTDQKDTKMIPKGHWGGIGGRFGAKTHDLIQLSAEQLQYFDHASTVK